MSGLWTERTAKERRSDSFLWDCFLYISSADPLNKKTGILLFRFGSVEVDREKKNQNALFYTPFFVTAKEIERRGSVDCHKYVGLLRPAWSRPPAGWTTAVEGQSMRWVSKKSGQLGVAPPEVQATVVEGQTTAQGIKKN
jgi:hypothetical protein